jgi:actin-related protein
MTHLYLLLGQSGPTICPVVEGFCELKGLIKSGIRSRMLDNYMLSMLTKKYNKEVLPLYCSSKHSGASTGASSSYHSYMMLELGRDIRESLCRTAESPLFDVGTSGVGGSTVYNNVYVDMNIDSRYLSLPTASYELPDGTTVDVNIERYLISEAYFQPSMLAGYVAKECNSLYSRYSSASADGATSGTDAAPGTATAIAPSAVGLPIHPQDSIAKLALNSALRCDAEVQQALLNGVVLCGGAATCENFSERFKQALEAASYAAFASSRLKVLSSGGRDNASSAFVGGSIVASLGSLHELYVSRREYEEFGPGVLDRKCP